MPEYTLPLQTLVTLRRRRLRQSALVQQIRTLGLVCPEQVARNTNPWSGAPYPTPCLLPALPLVAAAVVQIAYYGGAAAEPAGIPFDAVSFDREDAQQGLDAPVPISGIGIYGPVTSYSWVRQFALQVVTPAATTIANRQVALAASPPAGLTLFFRASGAYTEPSSGTQPVDGAALAAVPPGYQALTTSPQTYDAARLPADAGRNGDFLVVLGAVDGNYLGDAGAIPVPPLVFTYLEE